MPTQTILMVADEAEQRALFTLVLESKGYYADAVADAESALERLADRTYAILLTDYELPRMNGPELITRTRHCWPAMSIVLMTTHMNGRTLAHHLDVDGYFSKMNVLALPRILQTAVEHHMAMQGEHR